MSAPVAIDLVVDGLRGRVEELCRQLLPLGHREGAEWREARRAQGGLGDSLSVHLEGAKRGVWQHGAAGASGDALDLVAYLLFAGEQHGFRQAANIKRALDAELLFFATQAFKVGLSF